MNFLITCACISEILCVAASMYFPALLPNFQTEWGLTNTEAGWISGIYFGGYAVSVPFLVSLTDRVDPRKIYLLSAGLGAVSLMGFGFVAQGTWTATAFLLMAGISFAGTYMPGVKALSDRISGAKQSRAITLYIASIGVGTALSVFLAGWLTGHFGWRWAAVLMGLAPAAGIGLFALAVKPKPPKASERTGGASFLDFRPALRNRSALGYMLAYASHCWELFGFRSWMVAFMFFSLSLQPQINSKLSPQSLVTLILLAGVPASIIGNEGALYWGRRRFITIVMLISGLIGCLIGFAAGLPFIVVAGFCFAYWIAIMTDSGSLTAGLVSAAKSEEAGRTMALYSFIGLSMGLLAPLAVGAMLDITGGDIVGLGLAFATLGLVAMSGTVWIKLFRSNNQNK